MQGSQQSGAGKAVLPPHALALYQQQITMAHGESSQEVKQQQLPGQPGKQQSYNPQTERDREALHSSSPRVRPRSPSNDKDGIILWFPNQIDTIILPYTSHYYSGQIVFTVAV